MTDGTQQITGADAAAKLDGLMADPAWVKSYLAGSGPQVAEAHALMEAKSTDPAVAGDRLDKIIAGTADVPIMETTTDNDLSTLKQMQFAATLRDIGLTDPQIKQAMSGAQASKAEYDQIKIWRSDRMGDPEWTARYLKGGAAEVRQMALANTVIANGYVGQEQRQ